VIPSYPHPEYVLPEAEAEAEFLEKRFKATPVDPHPGPVRGLLDTSGSFDLLHFACHGVADSADIQRAELLLEGRVEGANYIMEKFRASVVEHLSGLAGSEGIHPIVTLNACQAGRAGYKMTSIGGFARAFLKQDAGMFTAAMWSVGDNPARTFTETLYDRLLKKDTLAQATIVAREAARKEREATWLAYTVYGNPHAQLIR
jgi:CHAT domain-containing protein